MAGDTTPLLAVDPNKTLIAVASLTDLQYHPLSNDAGKLYRSNNVSLLFRSRASMDRVLSVLIQHIKKNAKMQRSEITNIEVAEITDPEHGFTNTDDDYILP